jgi:hypothetical protein
MENQVLGNYLKYKAKSSGDFIPIYLPSAYHTIDVLTYFFFQKKHEWIAICFLDGEFQCHVMWIEKGIEEIFTSPSLNISMAVKFAKINNFKNILLSHNHVVTTDDVSCFKSYGININSSIDVRNQQFLRFSEGDRNYSESYLEKCNQEGIGFASSVTVCGEYIVEGGKKILKNIAANKPFFRRFRSDTSKSKVSFSNIKKPISFKKIIFKPEERSSKADNYKGLIGYYGLNKWWNNNFTLAEQNCIALHFNELFYICYDALYPNIYNNQKIKYLTQCILMEKDEEELNFWEESLPEFLSDLFIGPDNKTLQVDLKIFEKAETLLKNTSELTDLHNFYGFIIRKAYSPRFYEEYTEFALKVCKKQIEISHLAFKTFRENLNNNLMPFHIGYEKMAIVKEKEKKFVEVIDLCQEAQKEGWQGDWQKRIDRCRKKLSKL